MESNYYKYLNIYPNHTYTLKQVSVKVGISKQTIINWIEKGLVDISLNSTIKGIKKAVYKVSSKDIVKIYKYKNGIDI